MRMATLRKLKSCPALWRVRGGTIPARTAELTPTPNSGIFPRTMVEPHTETDTDLVKNSVLYKEFLAEREEILRHKWIESEKLGRDIGFEKALLDWIVKHRSSWRERRLKEHQAHTG